MPRQQSAPGGGERAELAGPRLFVVIVGLSLPSASPAIFHQLSVRRRIRSELTNCLSVNEFASELTNCLSVDEFASELTK